MCIVSIPNFVSISTVGYQNPYIYPLNRMKNCGRHHFEFTYCVNNSYMTISGINLYSHKFHEYRKNSKWLLHVTRHIKLLVGIIVDHSRRILGNRKLVFKFRFHQVCSFNSRKYRTQNIQHIFLKFYMCPKKESHQTFGSNFVKS